jgi:hypothetical protein
MANRLYERTPPSACLNCGKVMDAATGLEHKERPHEGAIAICINCSHIMSYDKDIKLRNLTDEEISDVAGHKDILRYLKALDEVRKKVGTKAKL